MATYSVSANTATGDTVTYAADSGGDGQFRGAGRHGMRRHFDDTAQFLVSKIAGHKRLSTTEKYLAFIERPSEEISELEEL